MKQIDVIRFSIQLLETNGPYAIFALPAKNREPEQLLTDREYVELVLVDDLERARRMKHINSRITELNKSI
ncbi:hypothetical protein [Exiguobacterium artemiae]|uniref:hypothetical protein n=1 Tax=Exiguobacterium artemiae TaxID=340145 RepID=UPI003D049CAD